MTPRHVGKYEVQRRLGAGGMGSLYLARDPGLDRLVAIKLLKEEYQDDPEIRERFLREARSVARLRHRNIIIVHEIGQEGGQPFIVLEYVAGETLTQVLRRRPVPPLATRLSWIEELCAGLAHAHAANIIHRDIKPANMMLDEDGVLKILDFGIARLGNSGMTQEGMMMGTVNYMSPEQIVGRGVDHRSDIFATGAVLYEVVALEQAFPGWIDSGVLHRILTEGPVPLAERVPDVPTALVRIVERALERDPAQRYQDLTVMRRDLREVGRSLRAAEDGGSPAPSPAGVTVVRSKSVPPVDSHRTGSERRDRLDPERRAELQRQQVKEYLRRGEAALAEGDPDTALEHAEHASMIDPQSRAADDLIDRARAVLHLSNVRQRLTDIERLLAERRLDEAAALLETVSSTTLDGPGAADVSGDVDRMSRRIAAELAREQQIRAALDRARASIAREGYDTALRLIADVLALDPARVDARDLEQEATAALAARRRHEQRRTAAYDALGNARTLAEAGRFEEAAAIVAAVDAPSETVAAAVASTGAMVEALRRRAAHAAILASARAAIASGEFEQAIAAVDSISDDQRSDQARLLRQYAEDALFAQHERARQRERLAAALAHAESLMAHGDLAGARDRLDDAAALDPGDGRIAELRRHIEERHAALEEARRRASEESLAADRVRAARRLADKGDTQGALACLEPFASTHPLVDEALRDIMAAIAVEERRAREAAERRRLEDEQAARRQAEEAQRRAEQQRADEERLAVERVQAARQRAGAGDVHGAAAALERFASTHPFVDAALAELRSVIDAQEALARESTTRRRRDEEARTGEEKATRIVDRRRPDDKPREEDRPDVAAPAAEPVTVTPAPPRARQSPRRLAWWIGGGGAAAAILAGALAYRTSDPVPGMNSPTEAPVPVIVPDVVPEPEAVPEQNPEPAMPQALPTATLQVDAQPWATVTIRPLAAGVELPQSTYVTPVHVQLPEGRYELRFENPAYRSPTPSTIDVRGAAPTLVRVVMPGFDADRALDAILGGR